MIPGLARIAPLISFVFYATNAFSQAVECELRWPQSCGALKPDPAGSFAPERITELRAPQASSALRDLVNLEEEPEILCSSKIFSSEAEVQHFISERLERYQGPHSLRRDDFHAAIVPTMVKAKYSSGRILVFGQGDDYFCVNDKGDRMLYGYPSREKE